LACVGSEPTTDPSSDATADAEQALVTCASIKRLGPAPGGVEDANIVQDPADPTKASTNYGTLQQMNAGFVGTDYREVLVQFDLGSIPPGRSSAPRRSRSA
jgi:hypothetical protein